MVDLSPLARRRLADCPVIPAFPGSMRGAILALASALLLVAGLAPAVAFDPFAEKAARDSAGTYTRLRDEAERADAERRADITAGIHSYPREANRAAHLGLIADLAEQSRRDEQARAMTGAPQVFPCTVEVGVFSRPELDEFWQLVRSSTSNDEARARITERFGKLLPLVFDGCTRDREKHRVVVHRAWVDPVDSNLALRRVWFQVEVVSPARAYSNTRVAVDLKPLGIVD